MIRTSSATVKDPGSRIRQIHQDFGVKLRKRSNILIPMQNPSAAKIVLASSSVYRQRLLERILDDYETVVEFSWHNSPKIR